MGSISTENVFARLDNPGDAATTDDAFQRWQEVFRAILEPLGLSPQELLRAQIHLPDGEDGVWKIFSSGIQTFEDLDPKAKPAFRRAAPLSREDLAKACAELEPNDRDNALRFLKRFPDDLIYVRGRGWHVWTGTHYELEGAEEAAHRRAGEVAAAIHDEAAHITHEDPDVRKTLQGRRHAYAVKTGNHAAQANMLAQVAVRRGTDINALDRKPTRVIVENGTLEFFRADSADPHAEPGTFAVRFDPLHDPAHLASRRIEAKYRANIACPRWLAFLAQVQPDPSHRAYLQTWAGLSMLGTMDHQSIVVHHGRGANGKSTYANALARILGRYSATVAAESFIKDKKEGGKSTPDLIRLAGVRSVQVHEYPRNAILDEALIKSVTGGERIVVRDLYKPVVELEPRFKLEIYANDKPRIEGSEEGIWRRMHLVPWQVMIPKDERRPMADLLAEFAEEADGILNWMIDGALIYLENGLRPPGSILAATETYREDSDPVGVFVRECVRREPGQDVSGASMYSAYQRWCDANALGAMSMVRFGKELQSHGLQRVRSNGSWYRDIQLHSVPDVTADAPSPPYRHSGE